jgi:diguanylate cyclase (GGDEF)-like protein
MMELKSWYRHRLPDRLAALKEVRTQLKDQAPESVEAVRRIAHSLRGSGATCGFPEIAESARLLEEADDRSLLGGVESLIGTLDSVCAETGTEMTSILLIEDDEDQARFITELLTVPGREILQARTAAEARAILMEREVSLVLLDLILPDMDGRTFLSRLSERFFTARIPVIVLTVKRASQARAECFALGADDFVEKPVKGEALTEAVDERLRLGPGVARALNRDPLTGLLNRAAYRNLLQRACAAFGGSAPATAATLALDSFEAIVKEHGARKADAAVRHAASVLQRSLRSSDALARFGGAEFNVLLPNTDPAGAAMALGNALQALRENPLDLGKLTPLPLGFSAGIASIAPGNSVEQVLGEADRHLHLAQDAGGGRVVSADDKLVPSRRRILVADDDELMRMVLEALLVREGFEPLLFADGRAALEAAAVNSVSMVITDGSMPVMNGFELVDRLRKLPGYTNVPIVMLTSMGSENDVVRGFELGADDYVVKPFSSAELLARIRRLLKRVPNR